MRLIEEVARVLSLRPDYFLEYRLARAMKYLDIRSSDITLAMLAFGRLESLDRRSSYEARAHPYPHWEPDADIEPFPEETHLQLLKLLTNESVQP